jgi:hypothetical protein
MKPKELANVLIKLLGLSFGLYAIPGFVSGIVQWISSSGITTHIIVYPVLITSGVQVAIGIFIIAKSAMITELLFKGQSE